METDRLPGLLSLKVFITTDKFEVKYGSLMVGPAYRLSDNFFVIRAGGCQHGKGDI